RAGARSSRRQRSCRRRSARCRAPARLRRRLLPLGPVPPAALLLARLLALGARPVDQLDQGERRGVTVAVPELRDPGVPPLPARVSGRDLVEELLHAALLADQRRRPAAGMEAPLLAERDHPITPAAELLGLGVGRADDLVTEERGDEVPEQRPAM